MNSFPMRKKTEGIYSKPLLSNTPGKNQKNKPKEKNFFITFEKSNTEKLKKEIKKFEDKKLDLEGKEDSLIIPPQSIRDNEENNNFNSNFNNLIDNSEKPSKLDFMKFNLKRNENIENKISSSGANTPSNNIYKKINLNTKTNFEKGNYYL